MSDSIEIEVRRLHRKIWDRRHEFCRLGCPPVELIHPKNAAKVLGYVYEEAPEICDWPPSRRLLIAGMVDPQGKRVVVSERFAPAVMRFTAAHEIGHIVLHAPRQMLRERATEGPSPARNSEECDADRFASLYLMPERLVCKAIGETFGANLPIVVDDNIAFWLDPSGHHELATAPTATQARALATCRRNFGGRYITPLHEQFQVSASAMAIRVKEIGAIRA